MNATSRLCLYGLAAAGIASFSPAAHATLQDFALVTGGGSGSFFCADNNIACDTNPTTGILQINTDTLDAVKVSGSLQASTGTPATPDIDDLNTGSESIINTTKIKKTALVEIGDISFSGPVNIFEFTASGSWLGAKGSSIFLQWFVDPANGQGAALGGSTPGSVIDSFANTSTKNVLQSFKFDDTVSLFVSGPFSMTLWAQITLTPHAELLGRTQAAVATPIPESSTWAMMLVGVAGLGYAAYKRHRSEMTPRVMV
jgi:hypothetical protein